MARRRSAESFRYEQRNSMSGLICFRPLMNGARSVAESGYLASDTTLKPCLSACAFAPRTGLFENGASAARIAIVSGFGDCFAARLKKPSVRASLGLGPVGIITK